MQDFTAYERLGLLLRELPPPPPEWVAAAKALPAARRALDEIDERVLANAREREAATAELEDALRRVEVAPTPDHVAALRRFMALRDAEL